MSGSSSSVTSRILAQVFPRVPDFYGMLNEQCVNASATMKAFVRFMETGAVEDGQKIREHEKKGDEIKARSMDILSQAFATPLDREDIYRAINSIDMILNYAKTTVREMEALQLGPDAHTLQMAQLLSDGVEALQRGYGKLSTHPAMGEEDAQQVRKAERNVEKVYRRAISELFRADEPIRMLEAREAGAEARAMLAIINMFKRRELYRHLSNAADQLAHAGDVLHDIIVQIS